MNTYEIPIIATSSIDAGALNKSSDGSSFELIFNEPIKVPNSAINCTLQVDEATVWWTTPNISASLGNNKLYVEYNANNYIITIPNGLYSVSDLNNAIDRELTMASGVAGLITLEPDNSTQKVSLTLNVATLQIDFTQLDTFRDILGFNSQLIPDPNPSVGVYTVLGDNVASFNSIEYFLLHSNLITQGIRTNNEFSQTIYQILIDVSPGSQIVSREFNPPKIDGNSLIGRTINSIKFWLTDQNNNLVDTNGEDYGCRVVIKYTMKN